MFIVHVHCSLFMFIVHCSHGATLIFDDVFKYQSLIPLCLKLTEKSLACFNCFSLMAGRKERESIDYSEVDKKYYSGFTSRLENTKCVQET